MKMSSIAVRVCACVLAYVRACVRVCVRVCVLFHFLTHNEVICKHNIIINILHFFWIRYLLSYNDMDLTLDIWQLPPSWLHPCKVCDQGHSVGKIKFNRISFPKTYWKWWEHLEIKSAKRWLFTLFETIFWKLGLQRNFWK